MLTVGEAHRDIVSTEGFDVCSSLPSPGNEAARQTFFSGRRTVCLAAIRDAFSVFVAQWCFLLRAAFTTTTQI